MNVPMRSNFLPLQPDSALQQRKAEGGLLQTSPPPASFQSRAQGPEHPGSPCWRLEERPQPPLLPGAPTHLPGLSPGASGCMERGRALERGAGEEGEKPSWQRRGERPALPSGLGLATLGLREGPPTRAPSTPLPRAPPRARTSAERRRPWSGPGALARCRSVRPLGDHGPLRLPPRRPGIARRTLSLTPHSFQPEFRSLRTGTVCWLKSPGPKPARLRQLDSPSQGGRARGEVWGLPPPAGLADVRLCVQAAQQCSSW
ncbi:hypothetical protein AAY473_008128, partial [Plecturocebus cupreus]